MKKKAPEGPPIPNLERVKTIVGDRVEKWTDEDLCAANAYIDVLAERHPPQPIGGHRVCDYGAALAARKPTRGLLCTCDPERPR